jgi:hypothetical protein
MADAGKKPMKVIKEGDMSPETKALPDEVVKPPKGIGESEKDMDPILKKAAPKGYTPKDVSSKKPEPTFKSDVDDIVSGVKKVDDRLNKGIAKAAGKTEKGILNTKLSKDYKKGGMVKSSASKRADGIAVKGKTRGKVC